MEGLDGEVDVGAGGGQRVVLPGRVVNLGHHLRETSRVIGCKQCQSYDESTEAQTEASINESSN